jgi:hypothetical protein
MFFSKNTVDVSRLPRCCRCLHNPAAVSAGFPILRVKKYIIFDATNHSGLLSISLHQPTLLAKENWLLTTFCKVFCHFDTPSQGPCQLPSQLGTTTANIMYIMIVVNFWTLEAVYCQCHFDYPMSPRQHRCLHQPNNLFNEAMACLWHQSAT